MPLPPAVADALNAQLGRELAAHTQYLAIASWFDAEALPRLAGFYADQAAEEHDHAMRFLAYLQEAGGPVRIPGIPEPRGDFAGPEDAVELSLQSERDVTARINEIMDLAIAERDHASQAFLAWFVTEQVEEEATMGDLLAITRRAGDAWLLIEDYLARGGSGRSGPDAEA